MIINSSLQLCTGQLGSQEPKFARIIAYVPYYTRFNSIIYRYNVTVAAKCNTIFYLKVEHVAMYCVMGITNTLYSCAQPSHLQKRSEQ